VRRIDAAQSDLLVQAYVLSNHPTASLGCQVCGTYRYASAGEVLRALRQAGICDGLMDAIVEAHDGKVQMIDSSIVRVHQHASGPKKRAGIVVWREAGAASPQRSIRVSTRKVVRCAS
jgi:hypothetical protein